MLALELKFSDEELTTIEDLAGCNFSPENIALTLDMDKKEFIRRWSIKKDEVRMAYDRGKMRSKFTIINKQQELAKSGNITAAQIFLKEAEALDVNNIRNRILFGDDY